MKIENRIVENELISHFTNFVKDPSELNNNILSELLNMYIVNDYMVPYNIYAILQMLLKMNISENNKFLINCIIYKTNSILLVDINNKADDIINNPFGESERSIHPYNVLYETYVVKSTLSKNK